MNHWLNAMRWLLIAFLVYVAAFMKEEQEGRWENTLQSWLDKVYVSQEGSYAKVMALARAVSRLSEQVTEKLFGERLLSLRSFLVSAYFGMASWCLLWVLIPFIGWLTSRMFRFIPAAVFGGPINHRVYLSNLALFVCFFFIGIIPAVGGENAEETAWPWRIWECVLLAIIFLYGISVFWRFRLPSVFETVISFVLLFGLNFLWDMVFIKATRRLLRIASNTRQLVGVLAAIVLDALLGIAILVGPWVVSSYVLSHRSLIGVALLVGVALKLIDFTLAFLVLIILTLVVIHSVVWFALERPISNCLRFKLIRDKKLIWFLAGALYAAPHIGFLEALLK